MNELTDPRGPAVEKRRKSQPKAPKGRVTMTDIARAAGCRRFQGYLFGRPVPLEEIGASARASSAPRLLTA